MSLPDGYLNYPHRSHGMDHERYDWSMLVKRKPVTWPAGARVALWITVALEWFPLDMSSTPFRIPGGMARAYPDYWDYTLRDYGNRVGVFRIMQVLDKLGIKASAAFNSALAERHPFLLEQVTKRGWEIIAHGVDMGHPHYGGMPREEEEALVAKSIETLRQASGQAVRGWWSPIKSQSENTADLAAAQGIDYICDWVNDDMPYLFRTSAGAIHCMPHPFEQDDQQMLITCRQSEAEFVAQVHDQFRCLDEEAREQGGRIMALCLHPWVSGQPYRIKALEAALAPIVASEATWVATGAEILDAFTANDD